MYYILTDMFSMYRKDQSSEDAWDQGGSITLNFILLLQCPFILTSMLYLAFDLTLRLHGSPAL